MDGTASVTRQTAAQQTVPAETRGLLDVFVREQQRKLVSAEGINSREVGSFTPAVSVDYAQGAKGPQAASHSRNGY